jgi:isopentenyl phosphate kinase
VSVDALPVFFGDIELFHEASLLLISNDDVHS